MRVFLFAVAVLFAAPAAQAQDLHLFDARHEVSFAPNWATPILSLDLPETMTAAMAAFADRADIRIVLASPPGDPLGAERRRAAIQALRESGAWPEEASRGVEFVEDARVGADRLRFGLRPLFPADPACSDFRLDVSLPRFFGDQRIFLAAPRKLTLPAEAKIRVWRWQGTSWSISQEFSPPRSLQIEPCDSEPLEFEREEALLRLVIILSSGITSNHLGGYGDHFLKAPPPSSSAPSLLTQPVPSPAPALSTSR